MLLHDNLFIYDNIFGLGMQIYFLFSKGCFCLNARRIWASTPQIADCRGFHGLRGFFIGCQRSLMDGICELSDAKSKLLIWKLKELFVSFGFWFDFACVVCYINCVSLPNWNFPTIHMTSVPIVEILVGMLVRNTDIIIFVIWRDWVKCQEKHQDVSKR